MKKFICITWLIGFTFLFAQNKVGTTAAEFLTIPVGTRAVGMGGAFVAVSSDITSAFYNPGSLARLEGNEFSANYSDWLIDSKHSWTGLGIKISEEDYVALSVISLDYGEEEVTTIDSPEGTGEMWEASDISVYLTYSRNLTDRFSIGGTVKYIQQKIWNENSSSFAADIGLLYKTQFDGLNIGMAISNFGKNMKLDGKDLLHPVDLDQSYNYNNSTITSELSTDSWELPLVFAVGLAWEYNLINELYITTATDVVIPNNNNTYLNVGGELQWSNMFFIQAGKNSIFKESSEEGISLGAAIKYELSGFKLSIGYAFFDFGAWGGLNRYSIAIGF